jgi:hypothetical protein
MFVYVVLLGTFAKLWKVGVSFNMAGWLAVGLHGTT